MFTGLIESTGTIRSLVHTAGAARLTIAAPAGLVRRLNTGDSVSVSGVCLTALDIQPDSTPAQFSADLAAETIARTSLSRLAPGSVVNLELPTPAGTPLGGHIVQGHVDSTGTVLGLDPVAPTGPRTLTDWWLRVSAPAELAPYIVEKGSIAIEGISLTVARVAPDPASGNSIVTIAILPHTYSATNLHTLAPGVSVNLEADVLAKYAAKQVQSASQPAARHFELTLDYLIANGY